MSDTAAVTLADVHKRYAGALRQSPVLDGVSLRIEPGSMVAITGPSGSGKTTLLNVVGGLDRDYEGHIDVFGHDLGRLDDRALSRFRADTVGFVFQSFNLLPHLSLLDNVLVPTAFTADRADRTARARELLALVGLGERLDDTPTHLSGGQRQRVAVARALINAAPLLLCDEPTGSLDARTSRELVALLQQVCAERGTTFLIVTHDPNVYGACGRLIEIAEGRVVFDGVPQDRRT